MTWAGLFRYRENEKRESYEKTFRVVLVLLFVIFLTGNCWYKKNKLIVQRRRVYESFNNNR